MATIKSYTDIEQSKVLAEILPLDSADYFYKYCIGHYNSIYYRLETYPYNKGANKNHDIPCWSLAALLSVLPDYTLQTNTNGTVFVVSEKEKPIMSNDYDNPVDACVAMIEKLHELNLL